MPARNTSRTRYHRNLRRYLSTGGGPNNWLQYALDKKERITCLTKTQTFFGLCLFSFGLIQLEICKEVIGCSSPGDTDCEEYYFGGWTKSGVNIWGGTIVRNRYLNEIVILIMSSLQIVLFGGYGWYQSKSPTYSTIGRAFCFSCAGMALSCILIFVVGAAWTIMVTCQSENSQGLAILFLLSALIYILLFSLFMSSTNHTGNSVHDDFPWNCRSYPDSDDEGDPDEHRETDSRISRTDRQSSRRDSHETEFSRVDYAWIRQESLPGYSEEPPPSYDTVFPSLSRSNSGRMQEPELHVGAGDAVSNF